MLGLEMELVEGLQEVDVGSWSGLTRSEVEERFPSGYRRWLEFGHGWDDGETYQALGERVLASVHLIAERHPGQRVLAVTHGGPIAPFWRQPQASLSTRHAARFTFSATAQRSFSRPGTELSSE